MPAVGSFSAGFKPLAAGEATSTCGYFGCDGASLPAYYSSGLAIARAKGYSVPINAYGAGAGAQVDCVNPDGTMVRVGNWQTYPPSQLYGDQFCYTGSAATCGTFKAPPMDVWFADMARLQVADITAIQAANLAAAQAYAAWAAQHSNPGTLDYNPNPTGSGGSGGGGTGGSGGGSGAGGGGGTGGGTTGGGTCDGFNVAGMCVPYWALGLGAAGAFLLMGKGRR